MARRKPFASALLLLVPVAALAGAAPGAPATVSLAPLGRQPRAAVSASGVVAVVYGEGDRILLRASTGGDFGAPVRVGEVAQLMLGGRRGPQVAATPDGFVVTAIGKAGDLLSWRSQDGGRSFSGPMVINDVPTSAREGLHGLAGSGSRLHVVWLDLRSRGTRLFASTSSDGGRTWEKNRQLYESPDGTVCECCQPTVAADERGAVAVMWRNWLGGSRDMYLLRSTDGGRTFAPATKLGSGTWPLQACPMDGGGLAVSGDRVATVWRREDVVYAAAPGSAEERLGPGRNAVVALSSAGAWRAWQVDGEVVLQPPGGQPARVGRGGFAAFGSSPTRGGEVVLVWENPQGGVQLRRLAGTAGRD